MNEDNFPYSHLQSNISYDKAESSPPSSDWGYELQCAEELTSAVVNGFHNNECNFEALKKLQEWIEKNLQEIDVYLQMETVLSLPHLVFYDEVFEHDGEGIDCKQITDEMRIKYFRERIFDLSQSNELECVVHFIRLRNNGSEVYIGCEYDVGGHGVPDCFQWSDLGKDVADVKIQYEKRNVFFISDEPDVLRNKLANISDRCILACWED